MRLTLKGSATSGWYAPPKGTHTGEKHIAAGSGKSRLSTGKAKKKVESAQEVDMGQKWPHEINDWGYENYIGWKDGLSKDEILALRIYSGDGFQDMNNALRWGDAPEEGGSVTIYAEEWTMNNLKNVTESEYKEFRYEFESDYLDKLITDMDSAVDSAKTPTDMMVYRGWGSGSKVGELSVGETFTDSGFVSTSMSKLFVDKHFKSANPVARIHVKRGQSAAYLKGTESGDPESKRESWFGATDEAEVLLPRGSTFRVISKSDDFIDMEMVED